MFTKGSVWLIKISNFKIWSFPAIEFAYFLLTFQLREKNIIKVWNDFKLYFVEVSMVAEIRRFSCIFNSIVNIFFFHLGGLLTRAKYRTYNMCMC